MSHEVVQVIILVKYIRLSNEMIQVTYEILTTRNRKMIQEQTLTWNDAVLEPNRLLIFTAQTNMDFRIIPWVGLLIVGASAPQRVRIQISCNGSRSYQTGSYRCITQSYTGWYTNTYIQYAHACTRIDIRVHMPTLPMDTKLHTRSFTTHTHTHAPISQRMFGELLSKIFLTNILEKVPYYIFFGKKKRKENRN